MAHPMSRASKSDVHDAHHKKRGYLITEPWIVLEFIVKHSNLH